MMPFETIQKFLSNFIRTNKDNNFFYESLIRKVSLLINKEGFTFRSNICQRILYFKNFSVICFTKVIFPLIKTMNKIILSANLIKTLPRALIRIEHFNNLGNCAFYSTDKSKFQKTEGDEKKKTVRIPRITLIENENMSVVTLDQAKKIADKRDMKLINIVDFDTKSSRAIYK